VKVSLIICTRNRASQLAACLKTMTRLRSLSPWELIIVDNGSTDDTTAAIQRFRESYSGDVTALVEPLPGLGRARNRGWRAAQGEIVAFTDDDCYPDPHFLDQVVVGFGEDKRLGFMGGRILLHDPTDLPITLQEGEQREELPPGSFIRTGLIQGANFALRKAAVEAVGGFDDLFGAGALFACEDVDILARISAAGWLGAYDPRPLVYHHHGRKTEAEASRLMRGYDRGRGAYYAKCLLNPSLRKVYLRNWYWRVRKQSLGRSSRELVAAAEYFARAVAHRFTSRWRRDPAGWPHGQA